ncbi:hypothetical protein [Vibrio nigripulchritudo]|uniref:hypothetical protein n=1 Tax=Vibrio nigripulchritudo TaxID=28173 RepID=UPI0024925A60|nr:hypothetical protein [Vibrio nigripulchritudo]BDU40906.1 hypothetical protein TUMSATVNIG2_53750 [Vibrio nigripulchritudo]BDU46644.1 hypothetical protein TUMSATVNIG3_54420 [Vibrio nigripulchritudo]
MKKYSRFLVILFFIISSNAYAEKGYVKGTVEFIRVHDDYSGHQWKPPVFWFTLNGVTSAGNCPKWRNQNVLFVGTSDFAYSMVLATYSSGKEIALSFDDSIKNASNFCIAKYITAGDPPPLN